MDFGILRSLAHAPTRDLMSFWAMCEWVMRAEVALPPEVFHEQWLPYALDASGSWPDSARRCPPRGVHAVRAGATWGVVCAHTTPSERLPAWTAGEETLDAVLDAARRSRVKYAHAWLGMAQRLGWEEGVEKALYLELDRDKPIDAVKVIRAHADVDALDVALAPTARALSDLDARQHAWLCQVFGRLGGHRTATALFFVMRDARSRPDGYHLFSRCCDALEQMGVAEAWFGLLWARSITSRYANRREEAGERLERLLPANGTSRAGALLAALPRDNPELERLVAHALASVLEGFMVEGSRATLHQWRESLWTQPYYTRALESVVWGVFDEEDRLLASFQVVDGFPVGSDAEILEIAWDARVGVPHPVELGARRDAWSEPDAPFAQLERSTYDVTSVELERLHVGRVPRRVAEHTARCGWRVTERDDGGRDARYRWQSVRDGVTLEAVSVWDGPWGRHVWQLRCEGKFGELHPVTRSEMLYAFCADRAPSARGWS